MTGFPGGILQHRSQHHRNGPLRGRLRRSDRGGRGRPTRLQEWRTPRASPCLLPASTENEHHLRRSTGRAGLPGAGGRRRDAGA
jgi:hypothetical protein